MAGRPKKNTDVKVANKNLENNLVSKTDTVSEPIQKEIYVEKVIEKPVLKQKQTNIPLSYIIPVKSAVEGKLVYASRKTGYTTIWENYGALEYMSYEDLVGMRNGCKSFFTNNWIFIEDTEDFDMETIYKALQIEKYYNDILVVDDIEEIINLPIGEFESKLPHLPKGVQDAIVTRAKRAIVEHDSLMDSIRKREVIEKILNVELIPKDI